MNACVNAVSCSGVPGSEHVTFSNVSRSFFKSGAEYIVEAWSSSRNRCHVQLLMSLGSLVSRVTDRKVSAHERKLPPGVINPRTRETFGSIFAEANSISHVQVISSTGVSSLPVPAFLNVVNLTFSALLRASDTSVLSADIVIDASAEGCAFIVSLSDSAGTLPREICVLKSPRMLLSSAAASST